MKSEAQRPGVGKYDTVGQKQKVVGNYTTRSGKGGILDEAIWKGMATPSHYPTVSIERYKPRTFVTKIHNPVDKAKLVEIPKAGA